MVIKDSDIELILQRVNVSYAEAEKALIKSKGDINRAMRYLERKENSLIRRLTLRLNALMLNLIHYQLVISRKDEKLINLPLILVIFLALFFADLDYVKMIILLLVIILTDCKISIHKVQRDDNTIMQHEKGTPPKTSSDKTDDITTTLEVITDDDYNEIYVEN